MTAALPTCQSVHGRNTVPPTNTVCLPIYDRILYRFNITAILISCQFALKMLIHARIVAKTEKKLEMWANAQRDGRPVEYR